MKRDFFSDEGKKAYEVCLQHYIERGNTEELAHQIVDHLNEEDILRTYEIIQQEKNVEESCVIPAFPNLEKMRFKSKSTQIFLRS
ncbi:hypothetical protein JQM60_00435 [Butyricicoccus pullicaecorum]|nr:hypothetical protein [Butyricicoccus pullicaecorum]